MNGIMSSTEPTHLFQLLRRVRAKDIEEEILSGHVFAKCSRDVFVYANDMYEFHDQDCGVEEYEYFMKNNGEQFEDIEVDEFVGTGVAWRDLGPITADEMVTFCKFYPSTTEIDEIAPDDPRVPADCY
jgi:hypothetical protein